MLRFCDKQERTVGARSRSLPGQRLRRFEVKAAALVRKRTRPALGVAPARPVSGLGRAAGAVSRGTLFAWVAFCGPPSSSPSRCSPPQRAARARVQVRLPAAGAAGSVYRSATRARSCSTELRFHGAATGRAESRAGASTPAKGTASWTRAACRAWAATAMDSAAGARATCRAPRGSERAGS
jgi:hypothetical protein